MKSTTKLFSLWGSLQLVGDLHYSIGSRFSGVSNTLNLTSEGNLIFLPIFKGFVVGSFVSVVELEKDVVSFLNGFSNFLMEMLMLKFNDLLGMFDTLWADSILSTIVNFVEAMRGSLLQLVKSVWGGIKSIVNLLIDLGIQALLMINERIPLIHKAL